MGAHGQIPPENHEENIPQSELQTVRVEHALGNTLASFDAQGEWTLNLADAEGRSVYSNSTDGPTVTNEYNAASRNAENEITVRITGKLMCTQRINIAYP